MKKLPRLSFDAKILIVAFTLAAILVLTLVYIVVTKNSSQELSQEDIKNSLATTTVNEKSDVTARAGYAVGYMTGKQLQTQFDTVKYEDVLQGIKDAYNNQSTFTEAQMLASIDEYQKASSERWMQQEKILAQENLQKSKEFLDNVKSQPDVKSTPEGILYKVIKEGTGAQAKETDIVTVTYEGKTPKGDVFDTSGGQPVQFELSDLISGLSKGIATMKEGGRALIYVPANLAYGESGSPTVEPNSALVFDIQLIKVGKNASLPLLKADDQFTQENTVNASETSPTSSPSSAPQVKAPAVPAMAPASTAK